MIDQWQKKMVNEQQEEDVPGMNSKPSWMSVIFLRPWTDRRFIDCRPNGADAAASSGRPLQE
jgi:hypothetical protein